MSYRVDHLKLQKEINKHNRELIHMVKIRILAANMQNTLQTC
jgi:hypothetical protein